MSTIATIAPLTQRPAVGCLEQSSVFQNSLIEDTLPSSAPAAQRRRQTELVRQAQSACRSCPLLRDCLYRAVVEHDVAGIAGATTVAQRQQIRARLGIVVTPEDFDTLAGAVGRHRQIDHEEVLRLRRTHPDESLDQIAHRLGCSLSTVKRHLRQERATPVAPRPDVAKPRMAAVLAAAAEVITTNNTRNRAA